MQMVVAYMRPKIDRLGKTHEGMHQVAVQVAQHVANLDGALARMQGELAAKRGACVTAIAGPGR